MEMPGRPAAFMSYVRFNDQHDDGQLSQFRKRLAAEVRAQTGQEFAIFQDRNDIAWGQNWQQRIDEALDTVTLLLVIITPGLFRSPACRAEITKFLDRERALDRTDLILPVYYIGTPEIDNPGLQEGDEMAKVLASRQLADWRELRFKPFTSAAVRRAIAQLASRMRDTFWQPPAAHVGGPVASGRADEIATGDASVVVTAPDKELHGEATNHGAVVHPATATLEVTVPEGFDVRHPNRLRTFRAWLSNPIETGSDPSSKKYPIEGRVAPLLPGEAVAIAIRTNQWYEQGVFALRPDGSFSGHVYLDESLPSAAVRFRILGADDSILKEYMVQVA